MGYSCHSTLVTRILARGTRHNNQYTHRLERASTPAKTQKSGVGMKHVPWPEPARVTDEDDVAFSRSRKDSGDNWHQTRSKNCEVTLYVQCHMDETNSNNQHDAQWAAHPLYRIGYVGHCEDSLGIFEP